MMSLANAGYRAIAPDFRGYGLSDKPSYPETTSFMDLVFDLLGLIDQLDHSKVLLIAKDFGIRVAYVFAFLHPDRVQGVITIGIPYVPRGRSNILKQLPKGCYVSRWLEPGKAEADFGRFDADSGQENIHTLLWE